AFIVSAVDHLYLVTLLLLWSTMLSYPFTTLVVLAVRRAFAGRGCRPYLRQVSYTTTDAPPYLHPVGCPCRVGHVGGPAV
ncbi:hypothetical protein BHE74_00038420, partial [Ensete ventricosum]